VAGAGAAVVAGDPPAVDVGDDEPAEEQPAATNAAFRLVHRGDEWKLLLLPGSPLGKVTLRLDRLALRNFRCFADCSVELHPQLSRRLNLKQYVNCRLAMMGWAVSEAHRLGMGVDMTTGTGWCFGGPQVTDQDANASGVVKTYPLAAGEKLKAKFNRAATQALVAFAPDGKSIEITDTIGADGEAGFSPTNGTWTV